MKRLIIISLLFLIPGALFSNSGPEKSIEVYTSANCPKCNAAINFLKKNWGPVGWNTVPKGTIVYPVSNKEYRNQLESLFSDSTDIRISDIRFPVIIMRNAGEPFPIYYNIENVEDLLNCKFNTGTCKNTSYKSGKITSGNYAEILTLDEGAGIAKIETVTLPDGSVYSGKMKNGKMHGQGILKFKDGSIYKGMMKQGKMDGQGIMKYPNGDNYDGQWKNNQMHGYGTFNRANGSWYQGNYRNGKFHGQGMLTEGETQKSGYFKNGVFTGN